MGEEDTVRTLPHAARIYILGAVCAAACCAAPALAAAPATVLDPAAAPLPAVPGPAVWLPTMLLALGYAGCQLAIHRARRNQAGALPAGEAAPVRDTAPTSGLASDWCGPVLLAGAFLLPPAAAALVPVPGALIERGAGPGPGGAHAALAHRGWRLARLALAACASAAVFGALDGPAAVAAADLPAALPRALGAALVCRLTLAALDWGAWVTADGRTPAPGWGRELLHRCVVQLLYGLVGLVMAVLWRSGYGPPAALLLLLPIGAVCRALAPWPPERVLHQAAVRALVQAVDLKDRYTRRHGERVGEASVLIARELGMAAERQEVLRVAGVLHDVGKLGVPTRLLRKNGPLTPQERRVIELHPEQGDAIVRDIACLGEARSAILHHHERLDGSGYPYGLAGRDIPEVARVVAVADAFDAMTSTRSYRRARPVSVAVEELRRCAGSQFDPRMVGALVRALDRHGWQPESVAAAGEEEPGGCEVVGGAACGSGDAARGEGPGAGRGVAPQGAYGRRDGGAVQGADRVVTGPGAASGGAARTAYGAACGVAPGREGRARREEAAQLGAGGGGGR